MNLKTLLVLSSVFILSSCLHQADTPQQVAQKYWDALKNGDDKTARQLVSSTTQQNLDMYLALKPEEKTNINVVMLSDEKATVSTQLNTGKNQDSKHRKLKTILILENGEWKIDASRTQHPMHVASLENELDNLAKQLSQSMQENVDSMDDTITEGLDILNEALRNGSKEMSTSLLEAMKKMNEALRESVDKMKKHRDTKPEHPENEDTGEGMI